MFVRTLMIRMLLMNRLLNAASIVAMFHKQPKRCPHYVRPLLLCMLCNTFAGCVTVHSPDAQLAYLEAELVPWLLQAPMHTRALATLKMQMVKTRLQKSKVTIFTDTSASKNSASPPTLSVPGSMLHCTAPWH